MARHQAAQMLHVVLHALGGDTQDVDQFVVVAIDKVAFEIQHVGKATGHAGAEILAEQATDW